VNCALWKRWVSAILQQVPACSPLSRRGWPPLQSAAKPSVATCFHLYQSIRCTISHARATAERGHKQPHSWQPLASRRQQQQPTLKQRNTSLQPFTTTPTFAISAYFLATWCSKLSTTRSPSRTVFSSAHTTYSAMHARSSPASRSASSAHISSITIPQ
jgi:hypothetical protein